MYASKAATRNEEWPNWNHAGRGNIGRKHRPIQQHRLTTGCYRYGAGNSAALSLLARSAQDNERGSLRIAFDIRIDRGFEFRDPDRIIAYNPVDDGSPDPDCGDRRIYRRIALMVWPPGHETEGALGNRSAEGVIARRVIDEAIDRQPRIGANGEHR